MSMVSSRQKYWNGLPFLTPGDLPDPGIKTCVSCTSCIGRQIIYHWATQEMRRTLVVQKAASLSIATSFKFFVINPTFSGTHRRKPSWQISTFSHHFFFQEIVHDEIGSDRVHPSQWLRVIDHCGGVSSPQTVMMTSDPVSLPRSPGRVTFDS